MVLGKKMAILIGNGAEIRLLEMGRKSPIKDQIKQAKTRKIFTEAMRPATYIFSM